MFEVECLDLTTHKTFSKWFYDKWKKDNFIKKCSFSKKIKVTGVFTW